MAWSTQDEKEFIKGIGTHSLAGKSIPRRDLLKGYLTSLASRANWDNIGSGAAREFAEAELAAELGAVEAVREIMDRKESPAPQVVTV